MEVGGNTFNHRAARNATLHINLTKMILLSQITSALSGTSMLLFFLFIFLNVLACDLMRSIFPLTLNYQPSMITVAPPSALCRKVQDDSSEIWNPGRQTSFPKGEGRANTKGRRGSLCGGRPKTAQVVSPAQDCKIMKKKWKRSHKLYIYISS